MTLDKVYSEERERKDYVLIKTMSLKRLCLLESTWIHIKQQSLAKCTKINLNYLSLLNYIFKRNPDIFIIYFLLYLFILRISLKPNIKQIKDKLTF